MENRKRTHWSTRMIAAVLALIMMLGNVPASVFAEELTGEEAIETTVPETSAPVLDETEMEATETVPETTAPAEETTEPEVPETTAPPETENTDELIEMTSDEESPYEALYREISVKPGQLVPDPVEVVENEIYGYVVNYKLKKGHTLAISDNNYVFSVRVLKDGNYSTMLKQATTASYTAAEDMTIGMLIRKPDKSALTAEELANVVIYDTLFDMKNVDGNVHRFTVEAQTIGGGTHTTRAAIFLPDSYSESGTPTRLIVMTNGYHGHLNDTHWNANKPDDVAVMKHYMDADYAVLVVDNTAEQTSYTADAGCPQQVSGYFKAYEYVQEHFNVDELFALHARSQGNLVALRIMREHPELVKCALMTGSQLSFKQVWDMVDKAFVANRFGFDDATGATYEAEKVIGYDPLVDADGVEYDLPPTFWMMAQSDASSITLSGIEKIKAHGNDVTTKVYTGTDHSGVCRLNIDECWNDALAYLNAHQTSNAEHRYKAWTVTKEATCTENGEMRRSCADCAHYETMTLKTVGVHSRAVGTDFCSLCGKIWLNTLCNEIPAQINKLQINGTVLEDAVYGHIRDYMLPQGHTLSISSADHVFSVRQLLNGDYSTTLKVPATADGYTAASDIIVGAWIRRPDSSELAEGELAGIHMIDSIYGMINVDGYVHRFTVKAETIGGGTHTTRAAIFLPDSYSESGTPTRLIVMTNGYSAYLTDSVWNGNTADNVGIIRNYLNAGYAVYVVDNTAGRTTQTPDIGCPQLVSSYRKAYEYIQKHFNVEEKFSIHSRSFGTFAAMRLMREVPELIKCAVMTGPRVSIKKEWPGLDKKHIANRFGFTDTTGATYEADKMVGHDPYTDVDGDSYALPPTYWAMSKGDATAEPMEVIEKLIAHGNDVTSATYTGTNHTGVCTLNTEEMFSDALAFLESHQTAASSEPMSMRYDDHLDMSGKVVEIVDAGKPTSYQVGYGVAEGTLDTAVVTLDGNTLVAIGIGTAKVKIDGTLYEVTVTAAPISLLLLIGQSNMQGSEGDANQSIVCPDGMVYATYGDRYTMTVKNATNYAPSALTGAGSAVNVNGTTTNLADWPVYLLNEAGAGKMGPDSGFAYEWVKQTGEKVWVVNAAHGGSAISTWQDGGANYEECVLLFKACQETLQKEIAAGHFTLSHMGYFWCQGCADYAQTAEWYVKKYLTMHNNLKTELAFDGEVTFEFGGIIPVRAGNESYTSYRQGVYADTTNKKYYESFKDLRFTGPRVAQYWMGNNPELPDIWTVCNIGENWVWMPDGTNGVTEYFQSHYPNGTVDYTTQVKQSASWYTPTTPAAVHDSIHYNQIGYNEVGREAARNALINLGEIEAPKVETTVKFLSWDGYTEVTEISAATAGTSGTLVVPMVYPLWKSKEVTYELSEGLTWNDYDLLAADVQTDGTLTSGGKTVNVIKAEPGSHFVDHLAELPENVCCGLNLWTELEHDEYYYANGIEWDIYSSGNVPSITILVNPGDKIYASSFGKAGTNGHSSTNGIRLTFFSEYGVVKTMDPAGTYAEFSKNGGYLIVPEGAVAINIPMWGDSAEWEIYILNREHDTSNEICSICGKSSHTHVFSNWETVSLPTADALGIEQRKCECGETETREVEGVWQKYALADHLQQLPDPIYRETNIWAELKSEKEFLYNGSYWGTHSSADVCSVTFPLNPGDQLYSNSFRAYPENGNDTSTSSGIRVTFFDVYGVAKTLAPAETYAEFTANGGYLVAPEGTIAVNVVQWVDNEKSEVRILNLPSAPKSEIADYKGKVISILGDSISTFAGYIPVADGFNLAHKTRYPQDNLLTDVNETWWMQIIHELDAKLGINDSWASTEVYNYIDAEVNSTSDGTKACMASLTRIQNLGSNGTPDLILFFGGTNDITQTRPLGTFDSNTAPTEVDLTSVKWGTVADAYVDAIMRMQHYYPDAKIVAILPYYRTSQGDGTKVDRYNDLFVAICEHYGVPYVDLRHCGITSGEIPDGTHPDADGMDDITAAVLDVLMTDCDMAAGEHMVHSVTHNLTNAESSLSYYKGISYGKSFVTTVSGENLTVTVTMGGRDVTEAVYQNGVVNIPNVTGDLLITATGRKKTVYEDYLQELPENICAGTNLWTVLEPINLYYRSAGWGLNSTGLAHSVTFCISAGDKIWATSFQESGINGGTKNGIALTWFDAEGVIEVLSPEKTYAEFAENGYLTAPKDAVAVNVVMWNGNDTNEVYILNRAHDYSGTSCIICGSEHPEVADYAGKVISILSASTSTFAGYIPVADGFNLEHRARYPQDNLLTDVNDTWWMQLINQLDAKLGINDSWAGSTVSNFQDTNSGDLGPDAAMASLTRIQNLGANGTPDVILFFGAGNDMGRGVTLGSFDPATAPTEVDLTATKWDSFADAYVAAIMRLQHFYPDAEIVVMTTYAMPSYVTAAKLNKYGPVIEAICDHYGVKYVDLRDCGVTFDMLPDDIHPNAEGMDYITADVLDTLISDVEMEAGEQVVHSVTHDLTNAESTLHYYKGVSHGRSFTTSLTGDDLTVTVTMGGQDVTEAVYANGVVDIPSVTGDLVITAKAKFSADGHLQQLPENLCAGTNLWEVLEPEKTYYTATGWGNTTAGTTWSITFPVQPGDRIWATSLGAYPENGSSANGVRVTWFDENGVLATLDRNTVYAEFAKNGYITAPEGAVALNLPMTNNQGHYAVYILSAEHDYSGMKCTICGAVHPEVADYAGKVISILGDSISTFAGYIPVADGFNLEHLARYPQDNLLTDVNETWWMQIIHELDAKLGINDSWRGATVSGAHAVTTGSTGENAAMHNLTRIQNLGSNGTPDVILFYGGTNDLAHVSKVGTFNAATAPAEVDLTTKKWDNLADGYVHTLLRLKHFYPDAVIVAMLPTVTTSYYSDAKLAQANEVLAEICEHYGVAYVDLRYCGITTKDLPDGIHPDATGMDYITDAVLGTLIADCDIAAGEHVVYQVNHNLTGVTASAGYIKGISAGKGFEETLSADNTMTVTVTMGGKDITESCYADEKITIEAVTGDILITAAAKFSLGDRLQQLPDPYYGVNLWPVLRHDADYYTATGWAEHSSGKVRSVTIPVAAGEKLYASSFAAASENGSSTNGIRITFFSEDGVLISMSAPDVYAEFTQNGYITVPENAVAVNIPMWTASTDWELYVWESSYEPTFSLGDRLQQLPAEICAGTNLWTALEPQNDYYTGSAWGNLTTGQVWSVTIPVSSGDQIYATSFEKYGSNGNTFNTTNGIRVTYFGENGILKSVTPGEVYTEFVKAGFLTVPEGANAVNIPMWSNSGDNELYILNREHDYKGTTCTICGAEHPEASDYSGKVISILGASICTFEGYIPKADGFNLEHIARYPQDNLLTDVNETWWMQVIAELDAKLGINDSWRSTEVYNACTDEVNSSYDGTKACLSSVTRIQNLGSNGTPDVILFFGGTNDITQRRPLGAFDPDTAPTKVDLTTEIWESVVDAYTALIMRLQHYYPDAEIIVMLPYSTNSNSDAVTKQYTSVFSAICEHYGVRYVDLMGCGIAVSDLPDGTHPNAEGMDYITDAVLNTLLSECDITAGENTVHSVTHELTGVNSSLGYYKGVSHGKPFATTITGEDLTVTVTMGGVDITDSVYANGVVNIPSVTGDLVITAIGREKTVYEDHLQQLPENICAGTNLWPLLEPVNEYYTVNGWGNNSNSNYSVTIPATAGDRIWATSFGAAGENGYSENAVRITWFSENGVLESLPRNKVYAEFAANGYVTAPEGAVALNVPMASDADTWELYILNLPHSYESVVTDPTCTEQGYTTHTCAKCSDTYVDTYVNVIGHSEVIDPAIQANSARPGLTEGSHCSTCGEVLTVQQEISPKGYDWMLEDGEFKILLIGNSFSEDASSCGQGMTESQLYNILQAMLGRDVKITLGLLYSGGKGVHWFATQTEQGNNTPGFYVITPDSNAWVRKGSSTTQTALSWTDWDVVTLQPYDMNFNTEQESVPYPEQTDEKFYPLEVATEYLLDYIDVYAPQADVYCYMHWARSNSATLNASLSTYSKFAAFYPKTLDYVGNESGKRYTSIIPVGLSIQNARTTYLSMLSYNSEKGVTVNLQNDPQIGLQRDGGHVTFNIGRYIAGLTFAETIIPVEMRAEGYVLPDIRITESVGKLPKEYTEIAQKSVFAAVESWRNGNLAEVTEIKGYQEDPTVAAAEKLAAMTVEISCAADIANLQTRISEAALAALPADFAVDAVTLPADFTLTGKVQNFTATVTIRFGYTSKDVTVTGTVRTHEYHAVVMDPTCAEQGCTTHTCTVCGDSYIDNYVDATGHEFGDWTETKAPTCTEKGEERRDCENCDHFETREVDATGHDYKAVVTKPTCEDKGFTTRTCSKCGDSYVDSYVNALGHEYGEWYVTKEATLEEEGEERRDCGRCDDFQTRKIPMLVHNYTSVATEPTCTEQGYTTHICQNCGDTYVDTYVTALGHSFKNYVSNDDASCTADGTKTAKCERCDETDTIRDAGTAKGHKFGEWTVTTEPTCTEKGMEQRDCDNCDHYETREVEAIGHDYETVVTAPTCTEQGYTTYTCACGDSYIDNYVDATGHKFGDWTETKAPTCTEKGEERRDCANCDHFETREVEAIGHDYETVVTKPTCEEKGYTTHTCSKCDDSYVDSYVDATGHEFGEWTVTTAPTCTEKGEERRDCENCDHFEIREVDAIGHDYKAVVTKPTCEEKGYTTHTCSKCGDSYVDSYVDALGHDFENGTCTNCGEPEVKYLRGDVDLDGDVDVDDVLALLWYVLFPDDYPISVDADFDRNGATDVDDVLALLWYVLFPEDYPLN